jgi:hypothetical protein
MHASATGPSAQNAYSAAVWQHEDMQPQVAQLFKTLASWWGEEPGQALASMIRDAPESHLDEIPQVLRVMEDT